MKQSHMMRLRPIRTVSWPPLLLGVTCHGLNMEVVDGLLELCVRSRLSPLSTILTSFQIVDFFTAFATEVVEVNPVHETLKR